VELYQDTKKQTLVINPHIEIDASLDTVNVAKLGDLLMKLSQRSKCQQFVVSHRPEMWERFELLIGVYETSKSAQLIPCHFKS
jgi:chromosome segregation ATPase